jgi:radical SAM family uncharacterized protein/radical SAM-linked protein
MWMDIDAFLLNVEKPLRYVGNEWNCISKRVSSKGLRMALAFPDVYEIGMSHMGLQILYSLINQRKDISVERVFAPWIDMEQELRQRGLPLFSLETHTPLKEFDIIGFSLQYEMNYTNVLNMLDLSGLPLRSAYRREIKPLIIAGGPVAFNPEPLADFIDLFVIGDGEEVIFELIERYQALKDDVKDKEALLKELSSIEGIYIPSLYAVKKNPVTGLTAVVLKKNQPIKKRIVFNLNKYPYPDKPIIPFCKIVHDRIALEIARGCSGGCRFCQAGIIYLPERERDPISLIQTALKCVKNTGYDEVSLSSLSPGDYSSIEILTQKLMDFFKKENISLSLASIKPSQLKPKIIEQIRRVRKTGFTLAPEAGTQRMRDVINKGIKEEEILSVTENVFREGWQLIKLYFMIGLPTEQSEDVSSIAKLTQKIIAIGKKYRRPWINLGISNFIPKPHSVFQWLPMERLDTLYEKQRMIKKMVVRLPLTFKGHNPQLSFLEGVFARGDRALATVLEKAWEKGCRFDGWAEQLKWDRWMDSFSESDISPQEYVYKKLPYDSTLPWDHISTGVRKEFLLEDLELALAGKTSIKCSSEVCSNCGVCPPQWIKAKRKRNKDDAKLKEQLASLSPYLSIDSKKRYYYRAALHKKGAMKFLSHLDFSRTIIRAFRRAGIPLAYSQGFHPLPLISFCPALALGIEAEEDYIDFITSQLMPLSIMKEMINNSLPSGLRVLRIALLSKKQPSLAQTINMACYSTQIYPDLLECGTNDEEKSSEHGNKDEFWSYQERLIKDFQSRDSIIIKRRKKGKEKKIDIRPLIERIYLHKTAGKLKMELWLNRENSVRPEEIIKELYPKVNRPLFFIREKLFANKEGKYFSPFNEEIKNE